LLESLRALPEARARIERARRLDAVLDRGLGDCWLVRPEIAKLVETALLHFDGQRYRMLAWCVMPNHVHALIEMNNGWPLDAVVHTWKSYTAHQASRMLLRRGPFWARDYFDRFIRNDDHLEQAAAYIEQNPVKAGLVAIPEGWLWSSAWRQQGLDDPVGQQP
jgi:REP element-mobilizing transposase RayT